MLFRALPRRSALIGLVAALWPFAGLAQPVPAQIRAAFAPFVSPERGGRACYERVYADAHLAAHPRQRITRMRLRIDFFETGAGEGHYGVAIEAQTRGEAHPFNSAFHCRPAQGGIACRIDCKANAIRVRPAAGGRVQLALGRDADPRSTCDDAEDAGRALRPGTDDRTFLLSALPPERCPPFSSTGGAQ